MTIVNGSLAFVTESCVLNVTRKDPGSAPGIVVNDLDQAVGMTLSIISHRFV